MKFLLYIFNFKNLLFGIFFGFFLIFIGSFIVNYIIKNSNHRLAKIYGSQSIDENTIFFIGNSRSVPFNSSNFKTSINILNLSHNSMTAFEVENIIKAIKEKNKTQKKIYIELTSLTDDSVQCLYSIFYDFKFYFGKNSIEKSCKRQIFFEKLIPISKINNELFYRLLYYYKFPEKDQLWTNNYKMSQATCVNPKESDLMKHFFSKNSEKKMYKISTELMNKYSDGNTKILFFIAPVYQNSNLALNMEKNFLEKKLKNLIKFNTLLDKKFFKNCNMFTDTLHLSVSGVGAVKKIIFSDF